LRAAALSSAMEVVDEICRSRDISGEGLGVGVVGSFGVTVLKAPKSVCALWLVGTESNGWHLLVDY